MGWSVFCDGVRLGGIYSTKEAALEAAAVAASILVRDGHGAQINVPEEVGSEASWPKRWDDLLK